MIRPSADFGNLAPPSPPRGGGLGWGDVRPTPRLTGAFMSSGGA